MRSGYTDELDNRELAMYRGRVASATRGKRGQAMLRMLLRALDEMPDKRLIPNKLVDNHGDVCLLGAGGKAMGLADLDQIDPEDHRTLAARFNVSPCLIAEIEYVNDEKGPHDQDPESRWARVREWVVSQLAVQDQPK